MKKLNYFVVCAVALATLSVGVSSCSGRSSNSGNNENAMVEKGWSFVLNRLKSPGSATLISYLYGQEAKKTVEEVCKIKLPECVTVGFFKCDAQNGFGALIRNTYYVFYKDGNPCHMEPQESLVQIASNSMYRGMLNSTLNINGCGCE